MLLKNLKNKKVALLAITSMLLISVCLLPCSSLAMSGAENMSHHGSAIDTATSHGKHLNSHSCHETAKADLQYNSGKMSCPHCDLYAPAALKDTHSSLTAGFYDILDVETYAFSDYLTQESQLDLHHPPPRFKQRAHKIHSVYII